MAAAVRQAVVAQTTDDMMAGGPVREFIMLAGKDSTGKTCAVLSLAMYIQMTQPEAKFYIIDTENKVKGALRSFGADAPANIVYYKVGNMNEVTEVIAKVIEQHSPGDWLATESLARVWERAQDLGYQAIEGVSKVEFLERKRLDKNIKSPIPRPDDFWAVVKGAHDGAFFDLLTQMDDLNCVFTTTIAKAKPDYGNRKENADRKALRIELGIDSNLEGAPRLPYYVETLCLLDLVAGNVTCRVLRDNLSTAESSRLEFEVPDKKSWGLQFYANCRG